MSIRAFVLPPSARIGVECWWRRAIVDAAGHIEFERETPARSGSPTTGCD